MEQPFVHALVHRSYCELLGGPSLLLNILLNDHPHALPESWDRRP